MANGHIALWIERQSERERDRAREREIAMKMVFTARRFPVQLPIPRKPILDPMTRFGPQNKKTAVMILNLRMRRSGSLMWTRSEDACLSLCLQFASGRVGVRRGAPRRRRESGCLASVAQSISGRNVWICPHFGPCCPSAHPSSTHATDALRVYKKGEKGKTDTFA